MQIVPASHLDHYLLPSHLEWLLKMHAELDRFAIATVELPPFLPDLVMGLYGPIVGDAPISEDEVTYGVRPGRRWATRFVHRPVRAMRPTRLLTFVAGPHEDKPCVLYTAYGGPKAPREPGDLGITSWTEIVESRDFWAEHALVRSST